MFELARFALRDSPVANPVAVVSSGWTGRREFVSVPCRRGSVSMASCLGLDSEVYCLGLAFRVIP